MLTFFMSLIAWKSVDLHLYKLLFMKTNELYKNKFYNLQKA